MIQEIGNLKRWVEITQKESNGKSRVGKCVTEMNRSLDGTLLVSALVCKKLGRESATLLRSVREVRPQDKSSAPNWKGQQAPREDHARPERRPSSLQRECGPRRRPLRLGVGQSDLQGSPVTGRGPHTLLFYSGDCARLSRWIPKHPLTLWQRKPQLSVLPDKACPQGKLVNKSLTLWLFFFSTWWGFIRAYWIGG